jgi:hypothetical protein
MPHEHQKYFLCASTVTQHGEAAETRAPLIVMKEAHPLTATATTALEVRLKRFIDIL